MGREIGHAPKNTSTHRSLLEPSDDDAFDRSILFAFVVNGLPAIAAIWGVNGWLFAQQPRRAANEASSGKKKMP